MRLGQPRSWKTFLLLAAAGSLLFACTMDSPQKKKRTPVTPGDDWWADGYTQVEEPIEPDGVNDNSGAFGAKERPSGSGSSGTIVQPDAGPKEFCEGSVAAGDLAVEEIMISSKSGSGDEGEWVEIRSTRKCWLKLQGVSIESPRGASAPNVVNISEDYELAPGGTFVVAGSSDPAKNNKLPGKVFAWDATDVLKNDGDTVTVKFGETTVDTVTYPNFTNLTPGRALAFPSDCKATERSSWSRWSLTYSEFGQGANLQRGTPNDTNDDVACF
jgi:hypothetical protein